MTWNRSPLFVTILACVYIAVGTSGFIYHFTDFHARDPFKYDDIWVEVVGLLAIVSGAFMLRGRNWARWLALGWIAFHVILSASHTFHEFAIHCLFCAVIVWCLFRPEAARYFRDASSGR